MATWLRQLLAGICGGRAPLDVRGRAVPGGPSGRGRARSVLLGHVSDNSEVPTYRDEAVVLRTHKLGEADRIITMLSRGRGKIRAVAKGVRRTSSKFGARLEPFSHVDLQFAEGRTLDVVTQVESLDAFGEPLDQRLPRLHRRSGDAGDRRPAGAEEGEPAVQQYQLLVGALKVLNRGTSDGPRPPTMILDSYLLRALAIAGYAPSFSHCARCGVVGPHQAFSPAAGGVVCERCRPAGSARPAPETLSCWARCWRGAGRRPATSRRRGEGGERADLGLSGLAPGPRSALAGPRRALTRLTEPELQPPAHWAPPAPTDHRGRATSSPCSCRWCWSSSWRRPLAAVGDRGAALPRRLADATGIARPVAASTTRRRRHGAGDPYFPDYGSSGYDATQYQSRSTWTRTAETLTGTTTWRPAPPQTSRLASTSTWRWPPTTVRVDGRGDASASRASRTSGSPRRTPIADGARFTVTVEYAGRPGDIRQGEVATPGGPPTPSGPSAGEPECSAWWFPANDHPSDPALMDVSVRVPAGMEAISVGRLESARHRQGGRLRHLALGRAPADGHLRVVRRPSVSTSSTRARPTGCPYVYAVTEQLDAADRQSALTALRQPAVVRAAGGVRAVPVQRDRRLRAGHELWFAGLETPDPTGLRSPAILATPTSPRAAGARARPHVVRRPRDAAAVERHLHQRGVTRPGRSGGYVERRGGRGAATSDLNAAYERTQGRPRVLAGDHDRPGREQLFDTVYIRGPMALQALRNVIGDGAFFALAREWAPVAGEPQPRGVDGQGAGGDHGRPRPVLPGLDLRPHRSGSHRGERLPVQAGSENPPVYLVFTSASGGMLAA